MHDPTPKTNKHNKQTKPSIQPPSAPFSPLQFSSIEFTFIPVAVRNSKVPSPRTPRTHTRTQYTPSLTD